MNSQKATYWIALCLMAFAFTSEYQRGSFPVFHRAASSASSLFCGLANNAGRTFAMARLIVGSPALPASDLLADARQLSDARQLAADGADQAEAQAETMRDQAGVEAGDQAETIREQAHAQADQLRDRIREQLRGQKEIIRAQQEMIRAQIKRQQAQLQRAQIKIHRANHALVGLRDLVGQQTFVSAPETCAQSGIRVALDSLADLSDNK
jgi:hypothetical protein